jgi:hypothetical protein
VQASVTLSTDADAAARHLSFPVTVAQARRIPRGHFPVSRSLPADSEDASTPRGSELTFTASGAGRAAGPASAPRSPFVDASQQSSLPASLPACFGLDMDEQAGSAQEKAEEGAEDGSAAQEANLDEDSAAQPADASQQASGEAATAAGGRPVEGVLDIGRARGAVAADEGKRQEGEAAPGSKAAAELRTRNSGLLLTTRHSSGAAAPQVASSRSGSLDLGMLPPREMQVCKNVPTPHLKELVSNNTFCLASTMT